MTGDNRVTVSKFQYWDYLEEILDNVQEGVYITDGEANTIYINHTYELISGLTKTEMLGKNMRDLVESGAVSVSGTLMVLESGESITLEQSFKTGKRAIITSAPVYDDPVKQSHIIMIVTSVREITELYSIRKELAKLERQNRQYASELERLHGELDENVEIVAEDTASEKTVYLAERVSVIDSPVFVSGEAGTGKEKMARFIHGHSGRSPFLFMRINFSVVPKSDPVRYLFGYEDADKAGYHMGILESADGGTLYLDEITEMPQVVRGRFFSLLRNGSCLLGDGTVHKLNVRIIAGSRYTLEEIRERHLLEEDILEFFSLFPLHLPPLRERRDDIIPLGEYFLGQYQRKSGEKKYFTRESFKKLLHYDWPGNVREVHTVVQRAAIMSSGEEIMPEDIMFHKGNEFQGAGSGSFSEPVPGDGEINLKDEVAKLEARYMTRAFARYGNIRTAAQKLGMDSSTFVRKRQRYEKMGLMDRTKNV